MDNIKEKMLDALHSVFWYEGLLGDKDDPIESGYDTCWLVQFINDLENNKNTKYLDMYTTEDLERFNTTHTFSEDEFDYEEHHTVIWHMLVEMFGSFGSSPRFGWIEQRKECAEFLKNIINACCVN